VASIPVITDYLCWYAWAIAVPMFVGGIPLSFTNTLVKDYVASDPRLHHVDTAPVMFDEGGMSGAIFSRTTTCT
jgi:hypothetical protein